MKPVPIISTIEQVMLLDTSTDVDDIRQRAKLLEQELMSILVFVDLALASLEPMDPARLDLEEVRTAAQRAIAKLSTISAHAQPDPLRRAG
jgi:hypothetical protein